MTKKILWIVIVILAIMIGCYPSIYFIIDRKFGLLSSKDNSILDSLYWNSAFYIHIILGGVALLVGWLQFSSKLRKRYLHIHRNTGKVYVITAILSAVAGLYIAFYATGGIIAKVGFIGLSLVWFYTTLLGYLTIVKGKVSLHQDWMIYSYAACLAAVTLRIWLPLLVIMLHGFIPGYRVVSWLCWVPNLVVAFLIVRKKRLIQPTS
ncbi:MAG: hypothetical protein DI538_12990 [Azospira oryzae]|nr:MAG: hypothetical protein DI538_12990 [Azospira oryzae]